MPMLTDSGLPLHLKELLLGALLGYSLAQSSLIQSWTRFIWSTISRSPSSVSGPRGDGFVDGVPGLVGHTPLVRIKSLSDLTGCEILGKAEFLNPGGSVKDRVALKIIERAESEGRLRPHSGHRIFEGTVGSTGISIATIAKAKGYDAEIIMPDDVAQEKAQVLRKLGAIVTQVRPVPIVSKEHFVNLARTRAAAFGSTLPIENAGDILPSAAAAPKPVGIFADQFENLANYQAHYEGTGPEIFSQTGGRLAAFVSGAGTGGTVAGVAAYLKKMNSNIKVVLADPTGSGLFNKIKYGVMFSREESEGTRRRHQVDTVVEGVGINRITQNFSKADGLVEDAIRVSDEEAVAMSRYLVEQDGLFLGSSSAVNLVAAVKLSKSLPKGSVIVTILCDSGSRHYSKFHNDDYLQQAGIRISSDISNIS